MDIVSDKTYDSYFHFRFFTCATKMVEGAHFYAQVEQPLIRDLWSAIGARRLIV